ncbi:hypothetical protein V6N13_127084 [Hibiscus sabdariffa]
MTSTIPKSKANMHASYLFRFLFSSSLFVHNFFPKAKFHFSSIVSVYVITIAISNSFDFFLQEEGWVVCRAFKKKTSTTNQNKTIEQWDSSYFYNEASGISTVVDPIDYISRQQPQNFLPPNMMCKREIIEADNLNVVHCDQFVQLPQLESPSLPLIKRPNSTPLISDNNNTTTNYGEEEEEEFQQQQKKKKNRSLCDNTERVTDWRALDKFVASQLSQEIRYGGDERTNGSNSDMALLLLQSGGGAGEEEEGNYKLNEFLNSSPDCDIGICVFDK